MGDPLLADEVDQRGRVELAHDDRCAAAEHAGHRPARAADVEQRHRHHVHHVDVSKPQVARGVGQQREEVVVGEHHALGQAGGARRVELEGDVGAGRLHAGVGGVVAHPRLVGVEALVGAEADEGLRRRSRSPRILSTMIRELRRRRRRPSPRRRSTIQATSGGASRQLTLTVTAFSLAAPNRTSKYSKPFLSRKATRIAGAHTSRGQRVGDAVRPLVELVPGLPHLVLDDGGLITSFASVHADDISSGRDRRHSSPPRNVRRRSLDTCIGGGIGGKPPDVSNERGRHEPPPPHPNR